MTRPVVMLTNAILQDQEGGLYRYVSELSAALARKGVDVTVLTKRASEAAPAVETTADGVRIERYDVPRKSGRLFALLYPFVVFAGVRRRLRRHRGAVVHAHFPVPALVPMLTGRRYLYTFHSPVHRELLGQRAGSYVLPRPVQGAAVAALRAVETWLVRRAHRVVLLSAFSRAGVAALDRDAGARAQLCPGGVDVERFRPEPAESPAPSASSAPSVPPAPSVPTDDDPSGDPLVVVARRLDWQTGVLETVTAMEHVVRAFPRARLVVLGDGRLREVIEQRVRDVGLTEHVTLLGHVGDVELVSWYRRATLVLMPAQQLEGFGLASVEAMACGTPVVATPIGANPEVVGSFDGGAWMAAGPDPVAIADAVVSVATDVAAGRWPAADVRAHVAPRFGWDAVADVHLEIYAEAAR